MRQGVIASMMILCGAACDTSEEASDLNARMPGPSGPTAPTMTAGETPPVNNTTCPSSTPQEAQKLVQRIEAPDGVSLAFSVFRPPGACEVQPVPLILWNHGYPERRAESIDDAQAYLDRGYAFATIDQRGVLGASGGFTSGAARPGIEDVDASAVLDWIHDELPWVQKEAGTGIAKDLVVGSFGNGAGGHLSMALAASDERIDAIMPYIAFSSILDDVFLPNGAPRALVADLFFDFSIRFGVEFEQALLPLVIEVADTFIVDPTLRAQWERSNASTFAGRVDVPTMFLQPIPDQVLGGLRAAVTNYTLVSTAADRKWLIGMNAPFFDVTNIRGFGTNPPDRERPNQCAPLTSVGFLSNGLTRFLDGELVFTFLDAFVKRDPEALARMEQVPRVLLPVEQEGCVRAESWPVVSRGRTFDLGDLTIPLDDQALELSLLTATEPTLLAGDVVFEADVPAGQDDLVLVSLRIVSGESAYIVNDQVYGAHTGAWAGSRMSVRLATVVTALQPGDELVAVVEGQHFLYSRIGEPPNVAPELGEAQLEIPLADTALIGDALELPP